MRRKIRNLFYLIRSLFFKDVVVCIGTSLSAGSGWVKMLSKELPYHFVNLAKGGECSRWGITQIGLVLLFRPKIILMEWAINDAYYKIPFLESSQNLRMMFKAFHKSEIYLLGLNPPLDIFIAGRNPAKDRPEFRKYLELHKEMANSHNIKYIDTTWIWDKMNKHQFLFYCPDGLHPNEAASKDITVPVILKEIKKV